MKKVELIPIDKDGSFANPVSIVPEFIQQACRETARFHDRIGFMPPWIGYVSISGGQLVGCGGFKGPPVDNRVEIAYGTLPELEGQGYATATARALIELAKSTDATVLVTAQTLPEPNASNALLKKLGFSFAGVVAHPEDGDVWEWHLGG